MTRSTHRVEPEDVMAYLDGELPAARASAIAAHLDQCADCSLLVLQLRDASQQLLAFEVEPAPACLEDAVLAAVNETPCRPSKPTKGLLVQATLLWHRLFANRFLWALAGACAAFLVAFSILPNLSRWSGEEAARLAHQETSGLAGKSLSKSLAEFAPRATPPARDAAAESSISTAIEPASAPSQNDESLSAPEIAGPMIVETAALTIRADDYDQARAAVERIVTQHQGFIAELAAKAESGSARELSATLRVPASQLESALAALRQLGHVEEETRSNEDVSSQYVDLEARLRSARSTEQRLLELLAQRTGKLSDVLDAERELARIRGEIESMQGQRAALARQVRYATVKLTLDEQYRETLATRPFSPRTQLRNALVDGCRNVLDGAMALLLFLLNYGPSLLFWLLILFWPARFIWRRVRASHSQEAA
jgi:anti-sigma factor RsiW